MSRTLADYLGEQASHVLAITQRTGGARRERALRLLLGQLYETAWRDGVNQGRWAERYDASAVQQWGRSA